MSSLFLLLIFANTVLFGSILCSCCLPSNLGRRPSLAENHLPRFPGIISKIPSFSTLFCQSPALTCVQVEFVYDKTLLQTLFLFPTQLASLVSWKCLQIFPLVKLQLELSWVVAKLYFKPDFCSPLN